MPKKREIGYIRKIEGKNYSKLATTKGKERANQKATFYRNKGYSVRVSKNAYPFSYTLWGCKR